MMPQLFRSTKPVPPILSESANAPAQLVAAVVVCPDWFGFTSDTAVSQWLYSTVQTLFPNATIADTAHIELLAGFDVRLAQTQLKVRDLLDYLVSKSGHGELAVQVAAAETAVPDFQTAAYCLVALHASAVGKNAVQA